MQKNSKEEQNVENVQNNDNSSQNNTNTIFNQQNYNINEETQSSQNQNNQNGKQNNYNSQNNYINNNQNEQISSQNFKQYNRNNSFYNSYESLAGASPFKKQHQSGVAKYKLITLIERQQNLQLQLVFEPRLRAIRCKQGYFRKDIYDLHKTNFMLWKSALGKGFKNQPLFLSPMYLDDERQSFIYEEVFCSLDLYVIRKRDISLCKLVYIFKKLVEIMLFMMKKHIWITDIDLQNIAIVLKKTQPNGGQQSNQNQNNNQYTQNQLLNSQQMVNSTFPRNFFNGDKSLGLKQDLNNQHINQNQEQNNNILISKQLIQIQNQSHNNNNNNNNSSNMNFNNGGFGQLVDFEVKILGFKQFISLRQSNSIDNQNQQDLQQKYLINIWKIFQKIFCLMNQNEEDSDWIEVLEGNNKNAFLSQQNFLNLNNKTSQFLQKHFEGRDKEGRAVKLCQHLENIIQGVFKNQNMNISKQTLQDTVLFQTFKYSQTKDHVLQFFCKEIFSFDSKRMMNIIQMKRRKNEDFQQQQQQQQQLQLKKEGGGSDSSNENQEQNQDQEENLSQFFLKEKGITNFNQHYVKQQLNLFLSLNCYQDLNALFVNYQDVKVNFEKEINLVHSCSIVNYNVLEDCNNNKAMKISFLLSQIIEINQQNYYNNKNGSLQEKLMKKSIFAQKANQAQKSTSSFGNYEADLNQNQNQKQSSQKSFQQYQHKQVFICGENGSGKSLILQHLQNYSDLSEQYNFIYVNLQMYKSDQQVKDYVQQQIQFLQNESNYYQKQSGKQRENQYNNNYNQNQNQNLNLLTSSKQSIQSQFEIQNAPFCFPVNDQNIVLLFDDVDQYRVNKKFVKNCKQYFQNFQQIFACKKQRLEYLSKYFRKNKSQICILEIQELNQELRDIIQSRFINFVNRSDNLYFQFSFNPKHFAFIEENLAAMEVQQMLNDPQIFFSLLILCADGSLNSFFEKYLQKDGEVSGQININNNNQNQNQNNLNLNEQNQSKNQKQSLHFFPRSNYNINYQQLCKYEILDILFRIVRNYLVDVLNQKYSNYFNFTFQFNQQIQMFFSEINKQIYQNFEDQFQYQDQDEPQQSSEDGEKLTSFQLFFMKQNQKNPAKKNKIMDLDEEDFKSQIAQRSRIFSKYKSKPLEFELKFRELDEYFLANQLYIRDLIYVSSQNFVNFQKDQSADFEHLQLSQELFRYNRDENKIYLIQQFLKLFPNDLIEKFKHGLLNKEIPLRNSVLFANMLTIFNDKNAIFTNVIGPEKMRLLTSELEIIQLLMPSQKKQQNQVSNQNQIQNQNQTNTNNWSNSSSPNQSQINLSQGGLNSYDQKKVFFKNTKPIYFTISQFNIERLCYREFEKIKIIPMKYNNDIREKQMTFQFQDVVDLARNQKDKNQDTIDQINQIEQHLQKNGLQKIINVQLNSLWNQNTGQYNFTRSSNNLAAAALYADADQNPQFQSNQNLQDGNHSTQNNQSYNRKNSNNFKMKMISNNYQISQQDSFVNENSRQKSNLFPKMNEAGYVELDEQQVEQTIFSNNSYKFSIYESEKYIFQRIHNSEQYIFSPKLINNQFNSNYIYAKKTFQKQEDYFTEKNNFFKLKNEVKFEQHFKKYCYIGQNFDDFQKSITYPQPLCTLEEFIESRYVNNYEWHSLELIRIFQFFLELMLFLQKSKVFHGNLKPNNIVMVNEELNLNLASKNRPIFLLNENQNEKENENQAQNQNENENQQQNQYQYQSQNYYLKGQNQNSQFGRQNSLMRRSQKQQTEYFSFKSINFKLLDFQQLISDWDFINDYTPAYFLSEKVHHNKMQFLTMQQRIDAEFKSIVRVFCYILLIILEGDSKKFYFDKEKQFYDQENQKKIWEVIQKSRFYQLDQNFNSLVRFLMASDEKEITYKDLLQLENDQSIFGNLQFTETLGQLFQCDTFEKIISYNPIHNISKHDNKIWLLVDSYVRQRIQIQDKYSFSLLFLKQKENQQQQQQQQQLQQQQQNRYGRVQSSFNNMNTNVSNQIKSEKMLKIKKDGRNLFDYAKRFIYDDSLAQILMVFGKAGYGKSSFLFYLEHKQRYPRNMVYINISKYKTLQKLQQFVDNFISEIKEQQQVLIQEKQQIQLEQQQQQPMYSMTARSQQSTFRFNDQLSCRNSDRPISPIQSFQNRYKDIYQQLLNKSDINQQQKMLNTDQNQNYEIGINNVNVMQQGTSRIRNQKGRNYSQIQIQNQNQNNSNIMINNDNNLGNQQQYQMESILEKNERVVFLVDGFFELEEVQQGMIQNISEIFQLQENVNYKVILTNRLVQFNDKGQINKYCKFQNIIDKIQEEVFYCIREDLREIYPAIRKLMGYLNICFFLIKGQINIYYRQNDLQKTWEWIRQLKLLRDVFESIEEDITIKIETLKVLEDFVMKGMKLGLNNYQELKNSILKIKIFSHEELDFTFTQLINIKHRYINVILQILQKRVQLMDYVLDIKQKDKWQEINLDKFQFINQYSKKKISNLIEQYDNKVIFSEIQPFNKEQMEQFQENQIDMVRIKQKFGENQSIDQFFKEFFQQKVSNNKSFKKIMENPLLQSIWFRTYPKIQYQIDRLDIQSIYQEQPLGNLEMYTKIILDQQKKLIQKKLKAENEKMNKQQKLGQKGNKYKIKQNQNQNFGSNQDKNNDFSGSLQDIENSIQEKVLKLNQDHMLVFMKSIYNIQLMFMYQWIKQKVESIGQIEFKMPLNKRQYINFKYLFLNTLVIEYFQEILENENLSQSQFLFQLIFDIALRLIMELYRTNQQYFDLNMLKDICLYHIQNEDLENFIPMVIKCLPLEQFTMDKNRVYYQFIHQSLQEYMTVNIIVMQFNEDILLPIMKQMFQKSHLEEQIEQQINQEDADQKNNVNNNSENYSFSNQKQKQFKKQSKQSLPKNKSLGKSSNNNISNNNFEESSNQNRKSLNFNLKSVSDIKLKEILETNVISLDLEKIANSHASNKRQYGLQDQEILKILYQFYINIFDSQQQKILMTSLGYLADIWSKNQNVNNNNFDLRILAKNCEIVFQIFSCQEFIEGGSQSQLSVLGNQHNKFGNKYYGNNKKNGNNQGEQEKSGDESNLSGQKSGYFNQEKTRNKGKGKCCSIF